MDSQEIRNMYANLLARSMNIDEKENVHPAFAEVIKQMSPLDAKVLKSIVEAFVRPILNLQRQSNGRPGGASFARHITWMTFASIIEISISMDNLQKCGLINVYDNDAYNSKDYYNYVRQSPYYIIARNSYTEIPDEKLIDQEGLINVSDFGQSFYNICIKDI